MTPEVGIFLPMPFHGVPVAEAARLAEGLGLDALWTGDHLMIGMDYLDATVELATAAAVTERVKIGTGVYLPALHEPAWAAKQIGTLAHVVPDGRFRFGVGIGGRIRIAGEDGAGVDEWEAAGKPFAGRAKRTDAFLERLEPVLAGEKVELDGRLVQLAPPVAKPPVWIGGNSEPALRRTARFGDGWLGSLVPLRQVPAIVDRLGELAAAENRPRPTIGTVLHGGLLPTPDPDRVERHIRETAQSYGFDNDTVRDAVVFGTPRQVADRLGELAAAGIEAFTLFGSTPWKQTAELLAEARSLLD